MRDEQETKMALHHVYEGLAIDTGKRVWVCWKCKTELGDAAENFKKFLLVREIPWEEIYPPTPGFRPDPAFAVFREFVCPNCGLAIENENFPPGYPPIDEFRLDIDALIAKERRQP